MTPREFVKAWLPNYWDRYRKYSINKCNESSSYYTVDFKEWIEENFDEALTAFAKAQRIACMDAIGNGEGEGRGSGRISAVVARDRVFKAPMPTPKE